MIRSMMLTIALAGAVGCVGQDAAADTTDETAQASGGGLFDCQNKASISGVQCVGDISVLSGITVLVKNVGVLDGNKISVLDNSLNNVKILDGNILDGNKILDDLEVTVLQDFLNKFNINVTKNDIDVCALIGVLQLCK